MADQWTNTRPGWVPPPSDPPPTDGRRGRGWWIALGVIAVLAVATGGTLAVVVAWRSFAGPTSEALSEAEWAEIEEVRDAVPAPAGFERGHEARYGGDGCSRGPSCEGDPSSELFFDPTSNARSASCDELRTAVDDRLPGTFRLYVETPNVCRLSAEIDGMEVMASLHSRDGTQWYIVTAGHIYGFDPDTDCATASGPEALYC